MRITDLTDEERLLRQAEADREYRLVRGQIRTRAVTRRTAQDVAGWDIPGDFRQYPVSPVVNSAALDDELRTAGNLPPNTARPGAIFANQAPTELTQFQQDFLDQQGTPTPMEQATGTSFAEKAWGFAKGAGKEFIRSFNVFEAEISTRERIFRTANLASLAIPIGVAAQSTRLLRAFPALRAAAQTTKGAVAIGAIETSLISGGLESIREEDERGEHGILTQMVLGGVLGGVLGRLTISGAKAARMSATQPIRRKFTKAGAIEDIKSPLYTEDFAIMSAQDVNALTPRLEGGVEHLPKNVEVHQELMAQLRGRGFDFQDLKMSDGRDAILIAGMTEDSAIQLAADMGQTSLITKSGLLDLIEGTQAPFLPSRMRVGKAVDLEKDLWITIPTEAGPVTFSPGFDIDGAFELGHPAIYLRDKDTVLESLIKHRPTTRAGKAVNFWDHLKGMDSRTVLSDWYDGTIRGVMGGRAVDDAVNGKLPLLFRESVADQMHFARVGWAGQLRNSLEVGVVRAGEFMGVDGLQIIGPGFRELQAKVVGRAVEFQKYGVAKHFLEVAEETLLRVVPEGAQANVKLKDLLRGAAKGERMPVAPLSGAERSAARMPDDLFESLPNTPAGDAVREARRAGAARPTEGRLMSDVIEEIEKSLPGSRVSKKPMTIQDLLYWDGLGRQVKVGKPAHVGPKGVRVESTEETWEQVLEQQLTWRQTQAEQSLVESGLLARADFLDHYQPDAKGKRTRNKWEIPIQETDDVVRAYDMKINPHLQIDEAGSEPFSLLRRKKGPKPQNKELLLEPWWDQMVREQAAYFRLSGQQKAANLMIERGAANPEYLARFFTRIEGTPAGLGRGNEAIPFQKIGEGKGARRIIRRLVDETPDLTDVGGQRTVQESLELTGVADEGIRGAGTKNQVSEFWQINDDVLWRDIERMGPMGQHQVASFLGLPAQILRTSATSSFEFLTKNPIRDLAFAFVNSGVNPMAFVSGMAEILGLGGRGGRYEIWLQAGGARAALTSQARNEIAQAVRLIDQGKMKAIGNVVAHPLEAMFKVSEFLENSTRVGSFNQRFGQLVKEGKLSHTDAALEAAKFSREASVDFGMAGSYAWMNNFRITTAFFNASLQGTDQMVRSAIRDPLGVSTRMFAAITVPSVALYMINRGDPDFDRLPPWEKMIFWHIKRGTGEGFFGKAGGLVGKLLGDDPGPEDDLWIRIPKPFEPGMLAGTLVEKFLESIDEEDPRLLDEQAGIIQRQILSGFIPMPTFMTPLLENMANEDAVTGRPIVPRGQEDVDEEFQRNRGTSAVSIALANFINGDEVVDEGKVSPLMIDNMVNGYAGGLGMTIWRDAGNIIANSMRRTRPSYSAHGAAPAKDFLQKMPGLRGMVSTFPYGSGPVEQAYDVGERSRKASRTAGMLRSSLQIDDYIDWVETHGILAELDDINRDNLDALTRMRDQRNLVYDAPGMDPNEKRAIIYQLDQAMMQRAEIVVQAMIDMGVRPKGRPSLLGRIITPIINPNP